MSLQIWIWAHLHIRYMHLGGQMPMVWSLGWLSWQFEMNGLPTVPNFNGTPVFGILAGDPRERKLQQVKYSHRLANIFVTVCERNPCFESSQDLCPAVHTNVSRSLYPSSKCIASWGTFRPGMRSTKTCQFLVPKTIVHGLWPTFVVLNCEHTAISIPQRHQIGQRSTISSSYKSWVKLTGRNSHCKTAKVAWRGRGCGTDELLCAVGGSGQGHRVSAARVQCCHGMEAIIIA